jgi:hypothetical protein
LKSLLRQVEKAAKLESPPARRRFSNGQNGAALRRRACGEVEAFMKSIFRLIVCLLLLVGWGLAALSLHVVVTPDEFPVTLVTKERFGITDTYVDTRKWTKDDLPNHRLLVQKLIAVDKAGVLKHVMPDAKPEQLPAELSDAIMHGHDDLPTRGAKATQPSTAGHAMHGLFGLF